MKNTNVLIGVAVIAALGYFFWKKMSEKEKAKEIAPPVKEETNPNEAQLGFLGFTTFGAGIGGGSHRVAVNRVATSSAKRKR